MNKETKIILREIKKSEPTKNILKIIWNRDKETKKIMSYDFYLVFNNEWDCVESTKNYETVKEIINSLNSNFEIRHQENFF